MYVTREVLVMIAHPCGTHNNESMNMSVISYAPKGKPYLTTDSLRARIGIVGVVQVVSYGFLWRLIFDKLELLMNENLSEVLSVMNNTKDQKRKLTASKKAKRKRSASKYMKF